MRSPSCGRAGAALVVASLMTLCVSCVGKSDEAPSPILSVDEPAGGAPMQPEEEEGSEEEDDARWAIQPSTRKAEPKVAPAAASTPEPAKLAKPDAPPPPVVRSDFAQPMPASEAVTRERSQGPRAGELGDIGTTGTAAGGVVDTPPADALNAALALGWRGADDGTKDMPGEDEKSVDRDMDAILDVDDAEVVALEGEVEPDAKGLLQSGEEKKKEARDEREHPGKQRPPRAAHTIRPSGEDPSTFVPPATTLPRMFYFENTYLGGSAAYAERLRRLDRALSDSERPYEVVQAEVQPFDPPRTEGLAVTASVDATHFERARRVFLQVGLRGSSRYGWRRPPLDVVLVVDQPAFSRGAAFVTRFVVDLLRELGPADRLGIVLAGGEAPTFLELARLGPAQQHLANRIDQLAAPAAMGPHDLATAMTKAGAMLEAASDDEATVPGTKTLMVLSGERDETRIAHAARAAHQLTVEGCVTSVFALDAERSEWWQVADAGYGNLHRIDEAGAADAIDEEMQSLARVVARLVRVNVRLGKESKAIRVLGTRVLEQREVEEVKARELATDRNLSKSLGITSDRGEDDDGIQTVIPYFYGDDSHVILIELWVEGPGVVADVTVRYKDMVNLDNATARTSVRLGARPRAPTEEQVLIARNVRGFELAENLQRASAAVENNDYGAALRSLGAAAGAAAVTNTRDTKAVEGLKAMVERGDWQHDPARRATLQETLLLSGQRRVGDTQTLGK